MPLRRGPDGRASQHVMTGRSQESVNYILSSKELGLPLRAAWRGYKRPAMVNLANPTTFLVVTRRALPWLALATAALFIVGLWAAFLAPPDYQQGETVKIMYIHVP